MIPDLLEEIFLRLPEKSILRFKTVSKEWRSILESKLFVKKRMSLQKKLKVLAVGDQTVSGFKGDEEIEMVYLHCDDATRPSLICEGLVCIPVPNWINVLNPLTRQLRRFPCLPRPPVPPLLFQKCQAKIFRAFFPGNWAIGFGRDKVNGSYKVVRMYFSLREKCYEKCLEILNSPRLRESIVDKECDVLDVEDGQWRKLNPPPYYIDLGTKSVCVDGSIYWLRVSRGFRILALNLHTLKFHDVPLPCWGVIFETQIANLDDRLAIVQSKPSPDWKLEIMFMRKDARREKWSKTFSINLAPTMIKHPMPHPHPRGNNWFMPVTLSKSGNIVLFDDRKMLFKYYQQTDEICHLSSDISVISPYVFNLVSLRSESGHHPDYEVMTSNCGLSSKHLEEPLISKKMIVFTSLVIVGFICYRSSKLM